MESRTTENLSGKIEILGIEHLGLASGDPEKSGWFFREILGLDEIHRETVTEQMVETRVFRSGNQSHEANSSEKSKLEVLVSTSSEGPIARYLEKKGGGIHHLAFRVRNISEALRQLQRKKIRVVGHGISDGIEGSRVVFIHPESTGGILVELVELAHERSCSSV
ncbi:MAG: VOC family protein [Deltaproteobacteria bacterium]|nr:VOC family protein [Deltaproteobacteria bacterium]